MRAFPAIVRVAVLIALSLTLVACGGKQRAAEGGEAILAGAGPSLMGPLEEQARDYLLDLAFIVNSNVASPDVAIDRLRSALAVNGEGMLENAQQLAARFEAMEGAERRLYEAQFAAMIGPAATEWRERITAFTRANPEAGREIAQIIERFDRR